MNNCPPQYFYVSYFIFDNGTTYGFYLEIIDRASS